MARKDYRKDHNEPGELNPESKSKKALKKPADSQVAPQADFREAVAKTLPDKNLSEAQRALLAGDAAKKNAAGKSGNITKEVLGKEPAGTAHISAAGKKLPAAVKPFLNESTNSKNSTIRKNLAETATAPRKLIKTPSPAEGRPLIHKLKSQLPAKADVKDFALPAGLTEAQAQLRLHRTTNSPSPVDSHARTSAGKIDPMLPKARVAEQVAPAAHDIKPAEGANARPGFAEPSVVPADGSAGKLAAAVSAAVNGGIPRSVKADLSAEKTRKAPAKDARNHHPLRVASKAQPTARLNKDTHAGLGVNRPLVPDQSSRGEGASAGRGEVSPEGLNAHLKKQSPDNPTGEVKAQAPQLQAAQQGQASPTPGRINQPVAVKPPQAVRPTNVQTGAEVIPLIQPAGMGAAPALTGTSPAGAANAAAPAQLSEQITAHVHLNRDNLSEEMTVQMNPPELGRIKIRFRSAGEQLHGVIQVQNIRTLVELRREAPMLMQRLNEAGIQVKNMEFQMNDPNQGRDAANSYAQNAFSMFSRGGGEGRGGEGRTDGDGGGFTQGVDGGEEFLNDFTGAGHYVSDSALNVMI